MSSTDRKPEFTGRHMLLIMVAFFGVVIVVNLTMAYFARSSWTGFVVENRYVASAQFNERVAESRAQAALGWAQELEITNGVIRYRLIDETGDVVAAERAAVSFRRPAHAWEDRDTVLTGQPDGWLAAPAELGDGPWIVEIHTEVGMDLPYRDVRRLTLRNGTAQ